MKRAKKPDAATCQKCGHVAEARIHQECYTSTGCPKPPDKWHEFVSLAATTCPLAPHILLAPVDEVGVYVVDQDQDGGPNSPYLVNVGYAQGSSDAQDIATLCGGGSFSLVYIDVNNKALGTSHVVIPGEPNERAKRAKEHSVRVRTETRERTAADAKADAEFRKTLSADEDALLTNLAEIHHAIVHERFGTGTPEDRDKRLSAILKASESAIEKLVGRMKNRGWQPWTTTASWMLAGIGAVSAMVWWISKNPTAKAAASPAAAGVGAGKAL